MKSIFVVFFILFSANLFAQTGTVCKDSTNAPNPYHICDEQYDPVCGCDGNDYRNECAAEYWGGALMHVRGICDNFDIDLYPNVITSDPHGLGHLRIYMKSPGTATLVIYNAFGKLMLQQFFSTSVSNDIIPSANPKELYEAQSFPRGVYILIVTVNNEKKVRKFIKVEQ